MVLLNNNHALRGVHIKLAEKGIPPRLQRSDENRNLAAAGNDLFPVQVMTLEFFRRRILIIDDQFDFLIRRDVNFGWLKTMVLYRDGEFLLCRREGNRKQQQNQIQESHA